MIRALGTAQRGGSRFTSALRRARGFATPRVAIGVLLLLFGLSVFAIALKHAPQTATVKVLVARVGLTPGTVVTASDVGTVALPLSGSIAQASVFADPQHIVGMLTLEAIRPGEIVVPTMVGTSGNAGRAYRTVAISVDSQVVSAEQLSVGSRVDVVVTYGEGVGATSETVATSVRVAAVTVPSSSLGASQVDELLLASPTLEEALAISQATIAGKVTIIDSTGVQPNESYPTYPPGSPSTESGLLQNG